jgi:electron transfer flavoprotein beta subunit
LRILVLVKQTPDSEADVLVSAGDDSVLVRDNDWRMNRFDEFAVEEALTIRGAFPGSSVEAVSVGPARVVAVLRRALAMGVNEAFHIQYEGYQDVFPGETALLIAAFARGRFYDLILAGVMSEDAMHGQTGPMVAELLDFSCAAAVVAEAVDPENNRITVERELEGGLREGLELPLPALIAVQSGINRPRYPALSHVLRSRSQPVLTVPSDSLAHPSRRERLVAIAPPTPSGKAVFLEGNAAKKAGRLAEIFTERAFF